MTANAIHVLQDALKLSPKERASLADQILSSLDQPDQYIDDLWRKKVEDRLAAYNRGEIKAVPLDEVLIKYRTKG
jgi:putative addiction module component (TIGR02574 family)